jgi:hypothetical protein
MVGKGSFPRLFGFFAVLFVPSLAAGAIFGMQTAERAMPGLFAVPFAALVVMALASGSVWVADHGGNGAYKISRAQEPIWYWVWVGLFAATSLGFLSFYVRGWVR